MYGNCKRMFVLLSVPILMIAMVPAAPFKRPPGGDGEVSVYRIILLGKPGRIEGWAAETFARYQPVEWSRKLKMSADGFEMIRIEKLDGGGRREITAMFKGTDRVRAVSYTDAIISPAGKVESRLEEDFTDPSLKYPADMVPILALPLMFRGADLESRGVDREVRIWWGPAAFSRGMWRVAGRKKVTVPAGTFECFEIEAKILIDDDGIIADTMEKLMPKFTYYLDVNPPHNLVRFDVPSPGRETISHQLVKFTPGK